jgi:N-acetylmuramoyl-L-alanine amidase
LVLAIPAAAATRQEQSGRSQFKKAERLREALAGRPAAQRSQRDYQRVISAYRRVYYQAPASSKAAPSVAAVAELMVEMGRQCEDAQLLRSAITQYEFLRKEYPGTRFRYDALFTIAQIYKDDLDDAGQSRVKFQEFLKSYPNHHLADQARKEIAELDTSEANSGAAVKRGSGQKGSKGLPRVTGVRHWSTPDYTRVAVDLEQDVKFRAERLKNPDRIVFDLPGTQLASVLVGKSFDVEDGFLKRIRVAQYHAADARIVLEVDDLANYSAFLLPNPSRLVIDLHGDPPSAEALKNFSTRPNTENAVAAEDDESSSLQAQDSSDDLVGETETEPRRKVIEARSTKNKIISGETDEDRTDSSRSFEKRAAVRNGGAAARTLKGRKQRAVEGREARPTLAGDRSLIRALGLKIGKIVIDPGHGGHDTGTIGPHGLREKDLVLDVGLRLGKLLQNRMGADVAFTREDDTFIPLETRTAVANQEQADLFVSIHANSSHDPAARGVETYYLNFTSSAEALEVAARENAVSEKSVHELQDLVKKIALKEKIEESREFAVDIQRALHSGLASKGSSIRDRGVKKAPFVVLIGANMPSILAEISFVSNPKDERSLGRAAYRQRIAESLYRGVARYAGGLSGVRVASTSRRGEGQ